MTDDLDRGFNSKTFEINELLQKQAALKNRKTIEVAKEAHSEEIVSPSAAAPEEKSSGVSFSEKKIPVIDNPPSINVGMSAIILSDQEDDKSEMTKEKYLSMLKLQPEEYSDLVITEEKAKKISKSVRRMRTGINSSVPMKCRGLNCPFAQQCIYVEENVIPLGKPCPIEKQLIEYWTAQYLDEFNVDINNTTEVYMVSELAEFNIYEKRITQYLAEKHQDLLQDVVTSIDQTTGAEIINQEVSRAWELKERIKKNRMKVLESLMATRKERVKLKANENEAVTPSEQMGELRRKLDEIKKSIYDIKSTEASIIEE